jgi:hypothetical protein
VADDPGRSATGDGSGGASATSTGTFDDTIDFGQGPLTAVGPSDAFVARLLP